MSPVWGWVLGVLGLIGFWFIGQRKWYGWAIGVGNECLWFTYGILAHQIGLSILAVFYGSVFSYNLFKKDHKDETTETGR